MNDLTVFDPSELKLTATGYQFPANMSLGYCAEAWAFARSLHGLSRWAVGDVMVYMKDHFPENYHQVIDTEQGEYNTWLAWERVARAFPVYSRVEGVSWSHHKETAAMDINEALSWLHKADEEGWSKEGMRDRIASHKAAKRVANNTPTRTPPASKPSEEPKEGEVVSPEKDGSLEKVRVMLQQALSELDRIEAEA